MLAERGVQHAGEEEGDAQRHLDEIAIFAVDEGDRLDRSVGQASDLKLVAFDGSGVIVGGEECFGRTGQAFTSGGSISYEIDHFPGSAGSIPSA